MTDRYVTITADIEEPTKFCIEACDETGNFGRISHDVYDTPEAACANVELSLTDMWEVGSYTVTVDA